MDENQKITGLKNIQGRIWKKGYHNGEIKGGTTIYFTIYPKK